MANVPGEKELRRDWDEFGNIGKQMNLVAEEGSTIPERNKVGL